MGKNTVNSTDKREILCQNLGQLPASKSCWEEENLRTSGREMVSLAMKLAWCNQCSHFRDVILPQYGGETKFLKLLRSQLENYFSSNGQTLRLKNSYQTIEEFFRDALNNVLLFASTGVLYTMNPDDPIYQAIHMLADNNIRRVPIINDQGALRGIFTVRDIIRLLARDEKYDLLYREVNGSLDKVLAQYVSCIANPNPITLSQNNSVWDAIRTMNENEIGGIPIISGENLIGIITERDIMFLYPLLERITGKKGVLPLRKDVVVINIDSTIGDAIKILAKGSFRRLPVMDGDKLVGIVTTTDIMQANLSFGQPFNQILEMTVEEIMIPSPIFIGVNDSLETAVTLMCQRNIGSLLVMEEKELCGIITERDILRCANSLF